MYRIKKLNPYYINGSWHIINNKHTYPHLADSVISLEFLDNILVIPLSSIERLAKDSFDDVDYVRNVARTIWDLGQW